MEKYKPNVKSYIMQDIIVPAIKDVILDAVRAFLGVNGRSGDNRRPTASRISYKDYYGRKDDRPTANTPRNRSGYDYEDYVITNRGEAEDVLSRMDEMISVYGMVSVAELFERRFTMDTNEIMNNEVIETTSGKALKVAGGIGLAVIAGVVAYKYIVKPMLRAPEFRFPESSSKSS